MAKKKQLKPTGAPPSKTAISPPAAKSPAPAAPTAAAQASSALHFSGGLSWGKTLLYSLILFFLLAFSGSFDRPLEKALAFLACLALLFLCAGLKDSRKIQRLLAPTSLAMLIFVFLGALSTFYAVSGKFAISEFSKILFAFVFYLAILWRTEASEGSLRKICTVFSTVVAGFSLLSIEAASVNLLNKAFSAFMGLFTASYTNTTFVEEGIRITSVFTTPNIFAGLTGLGILLGFYLVLSAGEKKERWFQTSCLAVSSLGFLLSFSMGATLCIGLAGIVFLVLTAREERFRTLLLFLETVLISFLMTFLAFSGLGSSGVSAWLPMAAVLLACLLLNLAETYIGRPLASTGKEKGRLSFLLLGAVAAAVLIFTFCAATLTGSYPLQPEETLRRAAYLEAGTCSLAVQADQPLTVAITSQNMSEVMMHKDTTLYQGKLQGEVSFTVPEDTKVVYFNFSASAGTLLEEALLLQGDSSQVLPLKYLLLPDFIANRLQGLQANENAIQRFVFFSDGLKLFKQNPLLGLGLGGFQNAAFSVQDFYYETKYVHNHYIQMLTELGILGFLAFLALLLCPAYALCQAWRQKRLPALLPALGACLVLMASHGAIEVVFSSGAYLPVAFGILAMIALSCSPESFQSPVSPQTLRKTSKIALTLFAGLFLLLFIGNFAGRMLGNAAVETPEKFFSNQTLASKLDFYEKNDYLLTYVLYAPQYPEEAILNQALVHAQYLSTVNSNTIQKSLASFYFGLNQPEEAFAMSRQILLYRKADPDTWIEQFDLYEHFYENYDDDAYRQSVLDIYALLQSVNENRMEEILLTDDNLAFIETCRS